MYVNKLLYYHTAVTIHWQKFHSQNLLNLKAYIVLVIVY